MDSTIRIADIAEQLALIEAQLHDPAADSNALDRASAIEALAVAQAILRELDALAQRQGDNGETGDTAPVAV